MAKVQRYPRGYLEMLRIVGEQAPSAAADFIQPVIDIGPLIRGSLTFSTGGAAFAASAPGDTSSITVPAGETWWVASFQAAFQATTIGDDVRLSIIVGAAGTVLRVASMPNVLTALSATARLHFGWVPPVPLILNAGDSIGAAVDDVSLAAGTRTLTGSGFFFRLASTQ